MDEDEQAALLFGNEVEEFTFQITNEDHLDLDLQKCTISDKFQSTIDCLLCSFVFLHPSSPDWTNERTNQNVLQCRLTTIDTRQLASLDSVAAAAQNQISVRNDIRISFIPTTDCPTAQSKINDDRHEYADRNSSRSERCGSLLHLEWSQTGSIDHTNNPKIDVGVSTTILHFSTNRNARTRCHQSDCRLKVNLGQRWCQTRILTSLVLPSAMDCTKVPLQRECSLSEWFQPIIRVLLMTKINTFIYCNRNVRSVDQCAKLSPKVFDLAADGKAAEWKRSSPPKSMG